MTQKRKTDNQKMFMRNLKLQFVSILSQNPGYYDIAAQDVSVWHVPNNADLEQWSPTSLLRYHTENHFLNLYGGNLFNLFKVRYTWIPVLNLKHS